MNEKGTVIRREYEQMCGDGEAVAWHWFMVFLIIIICSLIAFV